MAQTGLLGHEDRKTLTQSHWGSSHLTTALAGGWSCSWGISTEAGMGSALPSTEILGARIYRPGTLPRGTARCWYPLMAT